MVRESRGRGGEGREDMGSGGTGVERYGKEGWGWEGWKEVARRGVDGFG